MHIYLRNQSYTHSNNSISTYFRQEVAYELAAHHIITAKVSTSQLFMDHKRLLLEHNT